MRSGTAYSIPGRSVDLGEGGIAVVLAGEVREADAVGMEFLLPDLGLGLQTKAVVRYHSPLRCGFEFKDLTRHQQGVIREWARQRLQGPGGWESGGHVRTRGKRATSGASVQSPQARSGSSRALLLASRRRRGVGRSARLVALANRMEGTGAADSTARQPGDDGRTHLFSRDCRAFSSPYTPSFAAGSNGRLDPLGSGSDQKPDKAD